MSSSASNGNKTEGDPLRGQASSDVFSSTRHSRVDNMEFFSRDDSPYVKPSNNTHKSNSSWWWKPNLSQTENALLKPAALMSQGSYQAKPSTMLHSRDGYGGEGCERVNDLMKRTGKQWILHGFAVAVSGIAVFGLLVWLKGGKRTSEGSKTLLDKAGTSKL